jgi:eukaryotic-like serine/threonine-protein kinase
MTLGSGSKLLHYEVLGPLGAGAMGEVYRARDSKLGREVAIKVLPEHFADDEERLRRFEREAKTLASLNHPNVAQIFGVDQVGDTCFLVLELVPGESLEERLKRGALQLDEALDVCRQIAEGLEAAHEAGVIHRDLKPANIRLTPEGKVKVLDFGLAKPTGITTDTRTTDSVLSTEQGRLLGTPTYMAPEQARGKAIDRRIDVWAFGCVLYECLTGKRAFDGETLSDVLSSVLRSEVDLGALPATTPARVRECLRRCLHKDPRQRLRDIGEARLMLAEGGGTDERAALAPAWQRRLPWAIAACALVLAVLGLLRGGQGSAPGGSGPTLRFAVRVPHDAVLNVETNLNEQPVLALSPDGSTLVFVAESGGSEHLYLRRFDTLEAELLAGTQGATSPFFSPDGRWIAFFARGRLCKIAVTGGNPIDLCEVGLFRGGAWGADGTIVFAPATASGLMRIPSSGGMPVELTSLDPTRKERTHRWPAFLPGGREVAFTVGTTDKPGDYEDALIEAVALADGKRRPLLRGASMVKVSASGHLVLAREGQLLALPLAAATGGSAESAVSVLQGVAGIATSGIVFFDLAENGTLAYAQRNPHATEFELAWLARDGQVEPLPFPPREYLAPRLSPDGTRFAVGIGPGRGRTSDIWIGDLALGSLMRLTFDGFSSVPAWTPDGKRVAFGTVTGEGDALSWKAADGSDAPEILARFDQSVPRQPVAWSADGKLLLYQQDGGPGRSSDMLLWSLADRQSHELLATAAVEFEGTLSPDGAWLAYTSDDAGRAEVFVQAFPGPGGRWQVSERGTSPCWSRDGSELYYQDGRAVMAVPVKREPTFALGSPRKLFEQSFRGESETTSNYDVAPDGRFLVVCDTAEESMAQHVNVVLNWTEELRKATEPR